MSESSLEIDDVQALVLFAYSAMPLGAYLHVAFDGKGATPNAWLASVMPEIHSATRHARLDVWRVHVAFTFAGLSRFGLTDDERATFPLEIQEGMTTPWRSKALGDVGPSAPETWTLGGPGNPETHVLVLLFGKTAANLGGIRKQILTSIETHGGRVVHEDPVALQSPTKEPFGFKDGIGQPFVEGTPRHPRKDEVPVPTGEFILGYPNAYGETPAVPTGRGAFPLGKNGSFLVYRKLAQDTSSFWRAMLDAADPPNDDAAATKLASRIVGRWPSGAPLVTNPDADPGFASNEPFGFFKEDPTGAKCPFGAHIRRANPKDMLAPSPSESTKEVLRHRLLRRGRPYGSPPRGTPTERAVPDGQERGLVFLALNASLRRQYEFVQASWVNSDKFAGLYDERDPLVSTFDRGRYTMPDEPVRRRLPEMPSFVTMRGGGYFFVPGLRAMKWIAGLG